MELTRREPFLLEKHASFNASKQSMLSCAEMMRLLALHANSGSKEQLVISNKNITDENFSNLKLNGVKFENCMMARIMFYGTNLNEAEFVNCLMLSADFNQSQLRNAKFVDCVVTCARFRKPFMHGMSAKGTDFTGSKFDGMVCAEANRFERCLLPGVDMSGNTFVLPVFQDCIMDYARFTGSRMVNGTIHNCQCYGTQLDRLDATELSITMCALDLANMDNTILRESELSICTGTGASFKHMQLLESTTENSNFRHSDFSYMKSDHQGKDSV